jgi:hypothetical protein
MASLTQGSPLPDVTQTTSTTSTAPNYYTNYLTNIGAAGQTALQRTADQGVAGMDPLQMQGYGALEAASGAYKPMLSEAEKTARAAGAGLSADRIQQLLNPYQTNVVNEMERLQQQNIQRNVLPGLRAGFVGQGALGSQRYAGALGQTMADMQSNLTGQQYGALSAGYNKAVEAALNELQQQNQAAQTQGMLASKGQELGLAGVGALTKGGAERQAFEQSKLDYPLRTATTVSNLMRGYQVPMDQTQKFVGPKAGLYGLSPLQQATGLIGLLGSAAAGTAADRLSSAWNRIIGAINRANVDASTGGQDDSVYGGAVGFSDDPNRLMDIFSGTDTGTGTG